MNKLLKKCLYIWLFGSFIGAITFPISSAILLDKEIEFSVFFYLQVWLGFLFGLTFSCFSLLFSG